MIAAQRAYDVADTAVHDVVAQMPSGAAIAAEEASIDELRDELERVRGQRLQRLKELRNHPWWKQAGGDPLKAEAALSKAARTTDTAIASEG